MTKFNPFLVKALSSNNEQHGLYMADLGASGGVDMPWGEMAKISNTHCYGFEPSPAEFIKLKDKKNVKYFQMAISDQLGEVDFYDHGSVSSLSPRPTRELRTGCKFKKIKVKSDTLDNLRKKNAIPHIDILKIDIEGNEALALKGGASTLKNEVLYVKTEFSFARNVGNSFHTIDKVLDDAGFLLFDFSLKHYSFGKIKGGDMLHLKSPEYLLANIKDRRELKRQALNLITIALACNQVQYAYACAYFFFEHKVLLEEECSEIASYLTSYTFFPNSWLLNRASKFSKFSLLCCKILFRVSTIFGGELLGKSMPKENALHPSVRLWCKNKYLPSKMKDHSNWWKAMAKDLSLYFGDKSFRI